MRLLILGGTAFLGRHIVENARERGHELTLFNRGLTAPELFGDLELIRGDREQDLSMLDGRSWDAVIDTSGYLPRVVRTSATLLAGAADHYTFVSSISAYGDLPEPRMAEDAPLAQLPEGGSEDIDRYYGALKAACEAEVRAAFRDSTLVVRPGLIVGPHDPTGRFTYWVRRASEGGRVLAPDAPDQQVQLIDGRDLATWIVRMVEEKQVGSFNATGPAEPLEFVRMLERIRDATGNRAELAWIDEDRLAAAGAEPWDELPLWLDLPRHPELRGFLAVDVRAALACGLELRPLEQTVTDTLAWVSSGAASPKLAGPALPSAGLSREREAELLRLGRGS